MTRYGPHRPEDAPAAMTTLDGRECPLPEALVEQRRILNELACRGA